MHRLQLRKLRRQRQRAKDLNRARRLWPSIAKLSDASQSNRILSGDGRDGEMARLLGVAYWHHRDQFARKTHDELRRVAIDPAKPGADHTVAGEFVDGKLVRVKTL